MNFNCKIAFQGLSLATALLLLLPPAHSWPAWGAAATSPQAPPKFALVPAETYKHGQVLVGELRLHAQSETFLDRLLGINCYTRAVTELERECKGMDQEDKTRLALQMTNCQLATQGSDTFPCAPTDPLRKCVDRLPDREHQLYVEFLTHADSMCLFLQNREFEKYTETMLNRLSEGAGFAKQQLASVAQRTAEIAGDAAAIKAASGDAAIKLKEQGELQNETIQQLKDHRTEAAEAMAALSASQAEALAMAQRQVELSAQLGQAQEAVQASLISGQAQLNAVFGVISERAEAVAQAQGAAAAAQHALSAQLQALSDGSQGLRSAVDTLALYQQRSDAALIKLLGRSYTMEDVLFYGAGALGVVLSGATKATQRARLPLLALLAAALVGERLLVDKLHPWLDVNAGGEIVLALPVPTWLPLPHLAGTVITVGYKAAVRRVCMSLGVGLLVVVLFAHRDYERVNYRLLVEIREQQRRQEEDLRRLYQDQTMKARIAALAADTHRSRSPPTTQKERAPVGPVLDLGYQLTPAVESKDGGPSSAGAQALWLTAVGHTPQQAQERAVPSMLPSIPEREEQRDTAVERPASALGRRARIRRRTASVPDTENGGDGSKAPVRSTRRRTTAEESGKKDADAPEQGGTRRRRESSAGGEAQGQMQPSKRRKK